MSEATDKLEKSIKYVITKMKWQPHGGHTYCNQAAFEILVNMGYDIRGIIDPGHDGAGQFYTTCEEAAMRARMQVGKGLAAEVPEQIAQDLANLGVTVVAISEMKQSRAGHMAIVAPGTYTPQSGCMVGQAGGENGIFSRVRGFGKPDTLVTFPKFYVLPKRGA